MKARSNPDLKIRTFEKFDGSVWRQYETKGYRILLTGAGRRLFADRHMFGTLRPYVVDYQAHRYGTNDARSFLSEGGNATIFSLGDDLVVKESLRGSSSSLFASMERMDRLVNAVQKHCPRWIDVPLHYGALISKKDIHKQFMLEQKVDHGVTVGDVINHGAVNRSTEGVLAADSLDKFGPITPELTEEVTVRYASLQEWLTSAVLAEGLDPERYLPDVINNKNPYNIVLERLETPIAESPIRYWVIDQ